MDNREIRRKNLLYAIKQAGSVAILAESVECNEVYLRQIVHSYKNSSHKTPRKLGDSLAHSIADWLNVEPYWMDQPHPELWEEAGIDVKDVLAVKKVNDIIINQYRPEDVAGSMGTGLVLYEQQGVIQSWRVSRSWAHRNIPANTGFQNLRIITGFGDSMQPLFNSGDPILIDTGVNMVDCDGVFFFRIDNETFIKRLQRIPTKGKLIIRAISENRALYEPFDIDEYADFAVLGRVLKVWRGYEF